MEVDNCQNSNFCKAVFSNGSLCMSGSPECLCGSGGEHRSDGRCRGWHLSASSSSEPHVLSPAASSASATRRGGFPFECGVDSAGCIIDNSVIYLCFLGYSKQLSLSELNIACTGSVSLSCAGWRRPAVRWLFGPAERFRDVSWRPHVAQRVPRAGAGAGLLRRGSSVGLGARAWELGCAPCMPCVEGEPEQQPGEQGLSVRADLPQGPGCSAGSRTGCALATHCHKKRRGW